MIKAGIIGGSGYTGGELIRLLLQHPHASLDFVFSTTRGGQAVSKTHPDLLGITEMAFTDRINPETDVVFLCLGHGNSRKFLQEHDFAGKCRIIDLSNDFRLKEDAGVGDRRFTYGLPELFRKEIQQAENIANPGCYATAIQLALLPLAAGNKLGSAVHVNAVTGSTGAGTANNDTSHFSWRNNNVSWYKPFTHQHLDEIMQSLHFLQPNTGHLYFLPNRGNFTRGILATAYTAFDGSREDAEALYRDFYNEAPFCRFSEVTTTSFSLPSFFAFSTISFASLASSALARVVLDKLYNITPADLPVIAELVFTSKLLLWYLRLRSRTSLLTSLPIPFAVSSALLARADCKTGAQPPSFQPPSLSWPF
jgi:N-acetyl-gamma-glutamyl-phosphate reductase